jgi:hypothetical protein
MYNVGYALSFLNIKMIRVRVSTNADMPIIMNFTVGETKNAVNEVKRKSEHEANSGLLE